MSSIPFFFFFLGRESVCTVRRLYMINHSFTCEQLTQLQGDTQKFVNTPSPLWQQSRTPAYSLVISFIISHCQQTKHTIVVSFIIKPSVAKNQ